MKGHDYSDNLAINTTDGISTLKNQMNFTVKQAGIIHESRLLPPSRQSGFRLETPQNYSINRVSPFLMK